MADAPQQPRSVTEWWIVLGLSLFLGAAPTEALQSGLEPSLGYWGALVARSGVAAIVSGIAALVVSWVWQFDRRAQLTLAGSALTGGLSIPLAVGTFEGVRKALEPTLGVLGSHAVGVVAGFTGGVVVALILARLLRLSGSGPAEPVATADRPRDDGSQDNKAPPA